VLEDETQVILDMGVDIRYNTPITSLRALLDEGFDAIFVGVGAPRGKELDMPGRHDEVESHIHIGIDWLESVAFGHVTEIGERVSSSVSVIPPWTAVVRRVDSAVTDIKVMARRPREFFKASPWELDDAEEEGVEIIVNYAPKRFVIEDGRSWEWSSTYSSGTRALDTRPRVDTITIPCDDVILAIGQENAFPWIERDLGMEFGEWDMPVVDEVTMQSTCRASSLAATPRGDRRTSSGPSPTGTQAAISIHNLCSGRRSQGRPPHGHEPHQSEDGHERVELSQRLQPVVAPEDDPRRTDQALRIAQSRSGVGVQRRTDRPRSAALPQL
jgi:formate dehydrogenase beta subunit